MFDTWMKQLHQGDLTQQTAAIQALGASGNSKAVAPLVRTLHKASAPLIIAICQALAQLGDLRSVRPLLSQIKHEDAHVRRAALRALLAIGQNQASNISDAMAWEKDFASPSAELTQIAWHTDVEAMQALQQSLKDSDPEACAAAIYTLGQLGIFGSLEEIAQILYHQTNEELREAAIYALAQFAEQGNAEIQHFVLQAFSWVWNNGQLALSEQTQLICSVADLSIAGSQEFLRHALTHKDAVIRQFAMIGLARIGDIEMLPHFMQMLYQENSVSVQRNLLYAIASFKQIDTIPALLEFAMNKGSELRSAVASALQRMPQQDCWQALSSALQDTRPQMRAIATHLLAYLPHESALSQALQDTDPLVRKTALLSIGTAYLRNLRGGVQAHLQDEDWKVRVAAAESLKRLKDPASIPALRAASHDEHHVVRHAVESALNALLSS